MTLAQHYQRLPAWMLLLCILFSALHCASGNGQMIAMQLGVAAGQDHQPHHPDPHAGHGHEANAASGHSHSSDSGCDFASPFGAIILAAFFGLLGRLAAESATALPISVAARQPRACWPPANPRASPALLPVL